MEDTNVTQKHETPAERVARAREELSKAEAELAEVREAAIKNLDDIKAATVLPAGSLRERLYDAAHAWVGRANKCGEEGCDKPFPCPSDFAQAAFWEALQEVPVKFNHSDFIPRSEHERLVEEAKGFTTTDAVAHLAAELKYTGGERAQYTDESLGVKIRVTVERADAHPARPQDCEQEPVGWANLYDDTWGNGLYNTSEAAKTMSTPKATETAVPLYRRPAPLTEQAKLAAGDCVDYLIKEYRMDLPAGERVYSREYEGQKFTVTVSRAYDNIASAPAVAPKGAVEEINRAAFIWAVTAARREANKVSGDELKAARLEFEAALSRVTELPEPSEKWMDKIEWFEDRGRVDINFGIHGHRASIRSYEVLHLAAALLAAAKEVK